MFAQLILTPLLVRLNVSLKAILTFSRSRLLNVEAFFVILVHVDSIRIRTPVLYCVLLAFSFDLE